MASTRRHRDPAGFQVDLPAGWEAEANADAGGVEVATEGGPGVLHLVAVPQDEDSFPDPAEELYAFLEEQGVELEEDEVEDVELGDAEMSLCEFTAEDEDGEEGGATFWMVGVATAPGRLVFATYVCAEGEEEAERETVRGILSSLRFTD